MRKPLVLGTTSLVSLPRASISQASVKAFTNCTQLNQVYPGGVALSGAVNVGGVTKLMPKYYKKLYELNEKFDCDRDGIACGK